LKSKPPQIQTLCSGAAETAIPQNYEHSRSRSIPSAAIALFLCDRD
jgi:hypothetical protein